MAQDHSEQGGIGKATILRMNSVPSASVGTEYCNAPLISSGRCTDLVPPYCAAIEVTHERMQSILS